MKIIHVIDSLATGGAEQLVVDLAYHGLQNDHDVEIVLLKDIPGLPRERAKELGLPVTVLGKNLNDPRHLFRIRNATKSADIVHVHLFPALYWARLVKPPVVFTEHTTNNRRMGRPFFKVPEYFAYSKYSNIIAISEGVAEATQKHLRNLGLATDVIVSSNGIGNEFFTFDPIANSEPRRLISVGSLTDRKRHHLAIEAVALLPSLSLKIAGEGPLRKVLQERIDELGISHRVQLLGNIKNISNLLRENDLFISTSVVEGFGIAAVEAQAIGLPVVGPNIPGLREVIPDGVSGLLFNEASPETVARTILQALDEKNYSAFVLEARRNAERFSIASSFDAQMAVYKKAIASQRRLRN